MHFYGSWHFSGLSSSESFYMCLIVSCLVCVVYIAKILSRKLSKVYTFNYSIGWDNFGHNNYSIALIIKMFIRSQLAARQIKH